MIMTKKELPLRYPHEQKGGDGLANRAMRLEPRPNPLVPNKLCREMRAEAIGGMRVEAQPSSTGGHPPSGDKHENRGG